MSFLPTEYIPPVEGYPTRLLLVGQVGVGKSSLTAGLNKNGHRALVLDLQGGTMKVGGYIVNLKKISDDQGKPLWHVLIMTIREIREQNTKAGGYAYDFLVLDPLSDLLEICKGYATFLYNKTLVGQSATAKRAEEKLGKGIKFTEAQLKAHESTDVMTDLGSHGMNYMNQAFSTLLKDLAALAPVFLVIGHTKWKTLKRDMIDEFRVKEIDFWPSLTMALAKDFDEVGTVYRKSQKDESGNVLKEWVEVSFVFDNDNEGFKSRNFDGQRITLSEKAPDGKITTYMERLFPYLDKPKV